jgi:hypothetical protein
MLYYPSIFYKKIISVKLFIPYVIDNKQMKSTFLLIHRKKGDIYLFFLVHQSTNIICNYVPDASTHLGFLTLFVPVAALYWRSALKSSTRHMMIPSCNGMVLIL